MKLIETEKKNRHLRVLIYIHNRSYFIPKKKERKREYDKLKQSQVRHSAHSLWF